MIQNTWGIDYLPSNAFIVSMTYIQRLGGEGVGLYIYISVGDVVGERGFTNIRVPGDQKGSFEGVDGGKSS